MIKYVESIKDITPGMLGGFFEGWVKPHSNEAHLEILKNSDYVFMAIDTDKNKVVGYVTANTDHIQSAFIPLLEVLPQYRRRGIGKMLMKSMLDKLQNIPAIDLMCDKDVQPFYESLGMMRSVGMVIRNY